MNKELRYEILRNQCNMFSEHKIVFGEGNLNSKIMLIGEAPGETEVKQGHCFVGKAGKNLDDFLKILELNRDSLYITNAVKFRPTKINDYENIVNRTPNEYEVNRYKYYLKREIEFINPDIIVLLGAIAAKAYFNDFNISITRIHGKKIISKDSKIIFPLYHPASLIYNESLQDTYIKDLYKLKKILET